jgi:secreted trypsin-like serine protease
VTRARLWGALTAALLLPAIGLGAPAATADDVVASPRVVNGVPGPSEDFGFLVALGDRYRYEALGMYRAQICGGTLVSEVLVVTAAHCVDDAKARDLVVGSFPDGDLSSEGGTVVEVAAIRVHPRYQSDTQVNDIAVLTLRRSLLGIDTVTPATSDEAATLTAEGAPAQVAGWGAINHRQPWRTPSTYRIGELVVFPTSSCGDGESYTIDGVTFRGYGPNALNSRVMLCAEGVRDGEPVDSCVGDSGGPLMGGYGADRRLIGIVSWGLSQCATRSGPGVYTRVSSFTRFLVRAGVPLSPQPTDRPLAPRITRVEKSATKITVTVAPSAGGLAPDEYVVSARDSGGKVSSCAVSASPRPDRSTCTIVDLTPGAPYALYAIAIANGVASVPSGDRVVTPGALPAKPRISDVERTGEGSIAVFVDNVRGRGAPVLRAVVTCTTAEGPARSGKISARGIARIERLRTGSSYSCRAIVANEFGTRESDKVRVEAS